MLDPRVDDFNIVAIALAVFSRRVVIKGEKIMLLLRVLPLVTAVALSVVSTARGQSDPGGGLKAEIASVAIPADRRPVVTFKISDGKGRPLELGDLDADSVKFTIAALKAGKSGDSDYQNYVLTKVAGKDYVYKGDIRKPALAETLQPSFDQGGVLAKQRPGLFTYTFKMALPPNFARSATHVVGGEMTRGNRRYAANPLFEFIPAGGKVQVRRNLAETASCNSCHDPMRAHRGTAREVGYCVLCHTAQLTDPETGENLDLKYFVHKLHHRTYRGIKMKILLQIFRNLFYSLMRLSFEVF